MWKEVVLSGATWRLVSFFDVEGGSCQWDYLEVSIILSNALFSIIFSNTGYFEVVKRRYYGVKG